MASAVSYDAVLNPTSPSARVRTNTRFYAPELDALRFGAFLLVFCRHVVTALGDARHSATAPGIAVATGMAVGTAGAAQPPVASHWVVIQEGLQSLDFGVCLFFYLSSFLITRLLLLERESTGGVAVGNFYVRRALRIWPLYFVFLAVVVLLSHWLPLLRVQPSRLLGACLFVANWLAVLHGWQSVAIQPLWSVSVEEQFYAVWPWLARLGRRSILQLSALMMLASMGTLWFLGSRPGVQMTATWPNTFVQGLFLAGGAITACLSSPEHNRFRDRTRLLLIASGFAIWFGAAAGLHVVRTLSPGAGKLMAGYVLMLAGTVLIFHGVAGWNRYELPGWMIRLGRMSYGLYVFHVAVMLALYDVLPHLLAATHRSFSPYARVAVVSSVGLVLTMALASLSYRYLETPFLKLKDRFASIASRPV